MDPLADGAAGKAATQWATAPEIDTEDDDSIQHVDDYILEDNKEGLIDNPLLHFRPDQADERARQFAHDYGFGHLEELFVKGGRVMRDPEAWESVPGLTFQEKAALEGATKSAFREQTKELRVTIITLCIAAIIQGWNQTGGNGANLGWPNTFRLDMDNSTRDVWIFAIVNAATYLSASLIGCWLSDPLNEYFFGRRAAIAISGIFALASVIGGACTHNWQQLLVCRVLLGIGMGTKASVVPIYAAEVAPSHIRGSLVMNWQLFDALGIFFGFTANLVVSQLGDLAWRFQTASAFLPTILMLALIFVCPESPRFLMKKGPAHYTKAYESLLHLRGSDLLAAKELFYVHCQMEIEKRLTSRRDHDDEVRIDHREQHNGINHRRTGAEHNDMRRRKNGFDQPGNVSKSLSGVHTRRAENSNRETGSDGTHKPEKGTTNHSPNQKYSVKSTSYWRQLLLPLRTSQGRSINYWQKLGQLFTEKRIRRATLSAAVCMISQQLCGVNVLVFYSSTLLTDANAPIMDALWLSWGLGLTNFIFGIPAYWLIDKYGRRFLLLATIPGLAITMLAAGLCFNISIENSARIPAINFFFFLFMALYSVGMGPTPFTMSAEVFPLENRVVGMSFAVFLNLFGAGILTLVVPSLTDALGGENLGQLRILCIFAGLNVVAFILIFLFVRETAGATLGRTQENLNYISLEELNYIFGVPNLAHINYQIRKVLPWAFNHYIRRMEPSEQCPSQPPQLYKWAWDVERERKERNEKRREEQVNNEEEEEEEGVDGLVVGRESREGEGESGL